MSPLPKSATIGGTINLGNYDNIRFEFGAEITSSEDYLGLVEFTASSLIGQFKNSDLATQATVRAYLAKLCGLDEAQVPILGQRVPDPCVQRPGAPRQEDPATWEKKVPAKAPYLPRKEAPPAPEAPAAPAPAKPAAPLTAKCEKCGEGVTEAQKKLSTLFADKSLCKACLDEVSA